MNRLTNEQVLWVSHAMAALSGVVITLAVMW